MLFIHLYVLLIGYLARALNCARSTEGTCTCSFLYLMNKLYKIHGLQLLTGIIVTNLHKFTIVFTKLKVFKFSQADELLLRTAHRQVKFFIDFYALREFARQTS